MFDFTMALMTMFGKAVWKDIPDVVTRPSAVPNDFEDPEDDCCNLWDDENYGGDMRSFCLDGATSRDVNMHDEDWNNRMTSWACGKNVSYQFCEGEEDQGCDGEDGESGGGMARNPRSAKDDELTTLKLRYLDSDLDGYAILFTDADCVGRTGGYKGGETFGDAEEYAQDQLENNNMNNDDAESIMVPYGYSVDLFPEGGFVGDAETIVGTKTEDGYM